MENDVRHYRMHVGDKITIEFYRKIEGSKIHEDHYFGITEHGFADMPQGGYRREYCNNSWMKHTLCSTTKKTLTVDGLCAECMHERLVTEHDELLRLREIERKIRNFVVGDPDVGPRRKPTVKHVIAGYTTGRA